MAAVSLPVQPPADESTNPSLSPRSSDPSLPETIRAAQAGDRVAVARLLTDLQDPWYRFCLSLTRDQDLAKEAVQETAVRFLQKLEAFRGESRLQTWSLGIALNVVREQRRKRVRQAELQPERVSVDAGVPALPASRLITVEMRAALHRVLGELPDRQREAVLLRFFEDLSIEETARLMGCAVGTVKATVHQALRSLNKRLKEWA